MRVNVILRYVGMIMLLLAFFMFVSAGISYVNHMDSAFYPLLLSALLTALLGASRSFRGKQDRITNKEGLHRGRFMVARLRRRYVSLPDLGR